MLKDGCGRKLLNKGFNEARDAGLFPRQKTTIQIFNFFLMTNKKKGM
jgi:hypothetical protein